MIQVRPGDLPRTCSICRRRDRAAIDRALLEGESERDIARRFGVGDSAAHRHKPHISARLRNAHETRERASGDVLAAKLAAIEGQAAALCLKAEKAKDWRAAILAVRELTRLVGIASEMRAASPAPAAAVPLIDEEAATRVARMWLARHGEPKITEPTPAPEPRQLPEAGGTWRI